MIRTKYGDWQWAKYVKAYACSVLCNSEHVCICQYNMFMGIIFIGHSVYDWKRLLVKLYDVLPGIEVL